MAVGSRSPNGSWASFSSAWARARQGSCKGLEFDQTGCCPGCCLYEERKIAVAPGASDFKAVKQDGSGEDVVWETATRLRKYHPSYDPPEGTRMHKQCC